MSVSTAESESSKIRIGASFISARAMELRIGEIPLSVLRESIAYVPQDNFLFSDTLQTNIAFGVRIGASFISARAMELRCFCPPEMVTPRSPTIVEYFLGKSMIFSWDHAECGSYYGS